VAVARWACASVVTASILLGTAFAQDRASELRSRFAQETNAVRRAKLMPDLGDVEFREIAKDVENQHQTEALTTLRQYRDQARACSQALDTLGVDSEKHSSGFKQLQISLSESLRRLNTLLVGMTSDEQSAFLEVRKDLDEMNRHLIDELFPRRPAPKPEPQKPEP
jgi:hypothetical protein